MNPSLGVGYEGQQANWSKDIAYFKSAGVKNVRPSLLAFPDTWSVGTVTPGSYAFYRLCAQTFHNAGLWVTWGPSTLASIGSYGSGLLTSANYPKHHDFVVAEATYLQAQGIVVDEFEIGNELEGFIDNTTLTYSQLRTNLRQLATDVKAVYNLSPVSYGADNQGSNFAGWTAEGLGALDSISIHLYGRTNTTQNYTYPVLGDYDGQVLTDARAMLAAFGSKVYISEFNLDVTALNILRLTPEQSVTAMRNIWGIIKNMGVQRAIVFRWVGALNDSNAFAMQNTDGSFNPVWDVLLGNDRRTFQP